MYLVKVASEEMTNSISPKRCTTRGHTADLSERQKVAMHLHEAKKAVSVGHP
jgi:hypothetical protein